MHSTIQVESQYCPSPRRPNSLELTSCLTLEMDNDLENNNNSINNNNNNENNDSPFNRNHNSSRNKKKRRKAADIPEKQFNGKLWKMIFFLFFIPWVSSSFFLSHGYFLGNYIRPKLLI